MRKLVIISILGFLFSCTPLAHYSHFDIHEYYPIYGTQFSKAFPPADHHLAEGEGYVYYWGNVNRKIRRKGITTVEIDKKGYFYYAPIEGKVDIDLRSTCYLFKIRENDTVNSYFICEQRKYKMTL